MPAAVLACRDPLALAGLAQLGDEGLLFELGDGAQDLANENGRGSFVKGLSVESAAMSVTAASRRKRNLQELLKLFGTCPDAANVLHDIMMDPKAPPSALSAPQIGSTARSASRGNPSRSNSRSRCSCVSPPGSPDISRLRR
jgi:hypothetical protein